MRRFALCLAPFLFFACPGTNSDLSVPGTDADNDPPDATFEAEAGPALPLKVLTLNTLNFFNNVKDSEPLPVPEEIATATDYQAHLAAVAGVLTQLDPDVAILQEVENQVVVDDLAAQVGTYPHTAITQGNDPRGIDIAVLSKTPFQVAPSHAGEFFKASTDPSQTFTFARDVLEVHMIFNGRHVVLMGVHFKAETDLESQLKRLAEAERTREIVKGVYYDNPSAAIIVLGDFNCPPGSDPMNALLGTPPIQLSSAAASVTQADRWSVNFGGVHQLYDDQVMNENAAAMLEPASVTIPHGLNDGSDHDPVIATYLVN